MALTKNQGATLRRCAETTGSVAVSSANALIQAWEAEATRLNQWRNKAQGQHQHEWAARYGDVIEAFERCIGDLRRHVEATTVRQPPPNAKGDSQSPDQ